MPPRLPCPPLSVPALLPLCLPGQLIASSGIRSHRQLLLGLASARSGSVLHEIRPNSSLEPSFRFSSSRSVLHLALPPHLQTDCLRVFPPPPPQPPPCLVCSYTHLHGKHVVHPVNDRRIPIILDSELVDMSFGTGARAWELELGCIRARLVETRWGTGCVLEQASGEIWVGTAAINAAIKTAGHGACCTAWIWWLHVSFALAAVRNTQFNVLSTIVGQHANMSTHNSLSEQPAPTPHRPAH